MKILYLYGDLMNLYGESANPRMLQLYLQSKGISLSVDKKNFDDEINFKDYDVIYMGSGLESNQKLAIKGLCDHKDEISEIIKSGTIFLATGNSFEIFGKNIYSGDLSYECLGVFDFETSQQFKKRYTSDVVFKTDFCNEPVIGFINKCTEIHGIEDHLFKKCVGIGDFYNGENEGIWKFNFFGTHLTGPILVKNPSFLEKFSELIISRIKPSSNIQGVNNKNLQIEEVFQIISNYALKAFRATLSWL